MIGNYAQQGPRAPWQNHVLGHGAHPGTIGQFGCFVTSYADVATWAGYPTTPDQMDELFDAAGIFRPEADGTFDMMTDTALSQLWPDRFKTLGSWSGRRDDLIAAALPTPDQYVLLGLAWPGHSHFVPVVGGSAPDWLIGDSWDGVTKHLSAYGLNTVVKTMIDQALPKGPDPAIAAAAAAKAAADEKARILAAEAASAAAAKLAAEAKDAEDARLILEAANAAAIAEASARAAAAAQAEAEAAQAAHDRAVADAAKTAAAGKPSPDFWAILQAFLIALFRSAGHAQGPINKAQM